MSKSLRRFKRALKRSAKRSEPLTISYDKKLNSLIWDSFDGSVSNYTCPFCETRMNRDTFAGVIKYKSKPRYICGTLPCLLELSEHQKGKL